MTIAKLDQQSFNDLIALVGTERFNRAITWTHAAKCDYVSIGIDSAKTMSDLDDFFKARDKKYGVKDSPYNVRHYERDSKGNRFIRYNGEKLKAFADKLKMEVGDIVEQISGTVIRGNAPQYILDLLASKYDDAFIHKIGDYADQPIVYYTDTPGEAARHHALDYKLGAAKFETDTTSRSNGTRAFACVGHEYLIWLDGTKVPPVCTHLLQLEAYSMPTVAAPRVWWDEATGSYAVRTPQKESFNMFLKLIPEEDKKWDGEMKLWYISPRMVDRVKDKIQREFGSCSFIGPNTSQRPSLPMASDIFSRFVRLVGRDDLRRAYFLAAKRLHGDLGGQGDQMAELNVLWQAIEEALK